MTSNDSTWLEANSPGGSGARVAASSLLVSESAAEAAPSVAAGGGGAGGAAGDAGVPDPWPDARDEAEQAATSALDTKNAITLNKLCLTATSLLHLTQYEEEAGSAPLARRVGYVPGTSPQRPTTALRRERPGASAALLNRTPYLVT